MVATHPVGRWLHLVALAFTVTGQAAGQGPRGGELGRFEVPGLDFRPNGAWRAKAARVRGVRQQLLRAGNLAELNRSAALARLGGPALAAAGATPSALTGTVHVPVVLVAYSNVPVPYPVSDFQDVLFTPTPAALGRAYSLKTYYEEVSNGMIQVEGRVFDPVRMDTTNTYYEDGCNGIGVTNSCPNPGRFGSMLLRALDSISNRPGADTVWSQFDNDGPDGLPNSGDDDGVVDFVTFLHPTVDGACGAPGIWSHRFQIRFWNAGSPYGTKTPRRGSNGQPLPGQFIQVDDYTIQSQLGGNTGCLGGAIMPIGTVSHETGHAFGLPDLYDTDQFGSRTEGIGEWGIMGSGNFARSYSPASYDAWSLVELGWVTVKELTQDGTVETGPRQVSDTVFLARTPVLGEYFLVENRQAVESDTAQMNPAFVRPKAPGLLVWLIDENRIASGRFGNTVNTGPVQGVSLMQADGLNQLRTPGLRNRGDVGDSYPGATLNRRFGFSTNPSARNNFGESSGFALDLIEQRPNQAMRFRFTRRGPSLFRPTAAGAQIRVDGGLTARYEEVRPAGDVVALGVDEVQQINSSRTEVRFLAWSNGGPREQQLVSGVAPDTVTAAFSASHRVLAQTTGGGGLTASVPGNPALGIFVAEGSAVTLTATAPAGLLFSGWTGDTLSPGTTLILPMQRPYDVLANFVVELQISVDAATAELLGQGGLSTAERDYLDQLGNRNSGYDLGDYLAMLARAGLAPSPAVLARVRGTR